MIGLRTIIDEILNESKPIVFHNALYDIFLIYQYFFYDLPKRFELSKHFIQKVFPEFYDTKWILKQAEQKQTGL